MGSIGYIYGLVDPRETEVIRYVGKSTRPRKRLREHGYENSTMTYRSQWVRKLRSEGVQPQMKILAVSHLDDLDDAERRHIAQAREKFGRRLTNGTEGGTGGAMPPEVAKAAGLKRRGQKRTAEQKARLSAAHKKRCEDPAERERLRSIADGSYLPHFNGEENNQSKLTEDDIRVIRSLREQGHELLAIAERFDITKVNVWYIVTGQFWADVGGPIQGFEPKQRLSDDDVREMRRLHKAGYTKQYIMEKFGVSRTHVSNIVRNKVRVNI